MVCLRSFRRAAALSALLLAALVTPTRANDAVAMRRMELRSRTPGSLLSRMPTVSRLSGPCRERVSRDPKKLALRPGYALLHGCDRRPISRSTRKKFAAKFFALAAGDAVKPTGNGVEFSLSKRVFSVSQQTPAYVFRKSGSSKAPLQCLLFQTLHC